MLTVTYVIDTVNLNNFDLDKIRKDMKIISRLFLLQIFNYGFVGLVGLVGLPGFKL